MASTFDLNEKLTFITLLRELDESTTVAKYMSGSYTAKEMIQEIENDNPFALKHMQDFFRICRDMLVRKANAEKQKDTQKHSYKNTDRTPERGDVFTVEGLPFKNIVKEIRDTEIVAEVSGISYFANKCEFQEAKKAQNFINGEVLYFWPYDQGGRLCPGNKELGMFVKNNGETITVQNVDNLCFHTVHKSQVIFPV